MTHVRCMADCVHKRGTGCALQIIEIRFSFDADDPVCMSYKPIG